MKNNLILKKTIEVKATKIEVWKALTNPEKLKKTMFGCDVITDWKIGNTILFKGSWNGKDFVDKGTILDFKEGEFYEYNYWSNFSGLKDAPENYSTIKFQLTELKHTTIINLQQINFATTDMYEHSNKNWDIALSALKKLLEKNE